MTEVNSNMEKLVVVSMENLPQGKTILDYVDEEDKGGVTQLASPVTIYTYFYLVKRTVINELISAGVEVYFFPKSLYGTKSYPTDINSALSENDLRSTS